MKKKILDWKKRTIQFGIIFGIVECLGGCIGGENPICKINKTNIDIESLEQNEKVVIKGKINIVNEEKLFSYRIIKENNYEEIVAKGEIIALDGSVDSKEEEFIIEELKLLPLGRYEVLFYFDSLSNSEEEFKNKLSEQNGYLLLIGKDGKVINDRVYEDGEADTKSNYETMNFFIDSKEQDSYSYVVIKDNKTLMLKGSVTPTWNKGAKNYTFNIPGFKTFGDGNYEIRFYKESLEEIGINYENYIYINKYKIDYKVEQGNIKY